MISKNTPSIGSRTFEELKQSNDHGAEFWSARDLQQMLGYSQWRRFEDAINRAITSCEQSGNISQNHFAGAGKMVGHGSSKGEGGSVIGRIGSSLYVQTRPAAYISKPSCC